MGPNRRDQSIKKGGERGGGVWGLWEVATLNLPWVLGKVTIATKK